MATQSSYTTVQVSRFGFSVLSVTFNRANTQDVKKTVCNLIVSVTSADDIDTAFIGHRWDDSLVTKFESFKVDSGGDYTNDYSVSLRHFDITDEQVRQVMHTSRDTELMFF